MAGKKDKDNAVQSTTITHSHISSEIIGLCQGKGAAAEANEKTGLGFFKSKREKAASDEGRQGSPFVCTAVLRADCDQVVLWYIPLTVYVEGAD